MARINQPTRIWRREDWQRIAALHLVHHVGHPIRAAARLMRLPRSTIQDWVRQGSVGIRDPRLRSIAEHLLLGTLSASERVDLAEALRQAGLSDAEDERREFAAPGRKVAEAQTGVMVAFFLEPDTAEALARDPTEDETAVPADDLHVTLAFLGDTDDVGDPNRLARVVQGFAAVAPPVEMSVSGVGRFATAERMVYASVDAPALPEWRHRLVEHLRAGGFEVSTRHGFTPHISLCSPDYPVMLEVPPLNFTAVAVTLAYGDMRTSWPLEGMALNLAEKSPVIPSKDPNLLPGRDAERPDTAKRQKKLEKDVQEGWEQGQNAAKEVAQNHNPLLGPGSPAFPGQPEGERGTEGAQDLVSVDGFMPTILNKLALEAMHRYLTGLVNEVPHRRALHAARQIEPAFWVTDEQAARLLQRLGKGSQPIAFASTKPPPHVTTVFDQFEGAQDQQQALADYLYQLAQESYAEGLNAQLLRLELSPVAGVTDAVVLSELRQEADSIAQGVIETYNRDLAAEVYAVWLEQRSTLGRQSSLRTLWEDISRWAEARADDRADMISTTEYGRFYNRGVLDFLSRNKEALGSNVKAYVSPDECQCLACLALVQGNPYRLDEAQMLGLPLHPRCIHFLSLELEPAGLATNALWTAQAAA